MVGLVANPVSAHDIRRITANATSLQIADRANIVLRVLAGLAAAGVDTVMVMPDRKGITSLLERNLARERRLGRSFPEVRLGMIPGSGGTQRALRLIGMTRGKLFMMTGQRIAADKAEVWGLITQVVADDGLDAAVDALAKELADKAPLALRTLKMVLDRGREAPLDTALELERKSYAWLRSTHDYEEGVKSFLEKRPPKYLGR